jgi:hemolysin activation/secretion protein
MRLVKTLCLFRWRQRRFGCALALGLSSVGLAGQALPIPPPTLESTNHLSVQARLFVRGYRFEGNTAFSQAELARVTEPFANREVTSDELEQARRAVTLYYVNHGYVNSGAVIPDQDPAGGVVTIRVVEGVLSGIEVHGNKWLRDGYITSRVRRWSAPPLNLNQLQDGLQLLRQNPNARQVNAELKPGAGPGDSVLDLRVADQQPFRAGLQFDNQRPPSVGAEEIWVLASDLNLTGNSDVLDLRYGIANSSPEGLELSGADNMEGSYTLPLTRFDTSLGLHASRLATSLIEEQFNPLDVRSLTTTYGGVLRQPVYQTGSREAAVAFGFDHRVNTSTLLGERFNISPGSVNGEMIVSVARFSQEWIDRGQNHLLALRSTFNFGTDLFDATDDHISGDPNGKFFYWLGQGQYLQRLFNTQNQLLLRTAIQWTSEPLLALEQFSVGGLESVRGYRENELVRDRGVVASAEVRIPVVFDKAGAGIVYLAPFFDFGGGWNVRGSPSPTTLESIGCGLLIKPNRHIDAQLYWGYRLQHIDVPADKDPQDLGLHFKVAIGLF